MWREIPILPCIYWSGLTDSYKGERAGRQWHDECTETKTASGDQKWYPHCIEERIERMSIIEWVLSTVLRPKCSFWSLRTTREATENRLSINAYEGHKRLRILRRRQDSRSNIIDGEA